MARYGPAELAHMQRFVKEAVLLAFPVALKKGVDYAAKHAANTAAGKARVKMAITSTAAKNHNAKTKTITAKVTVR